MNTQFFRIIAVLGTALILVCGSSATQKTAKVTEVIDESSSQALQYEELNDDSQEEIMDEPPLDDVTEKPDEEPLLRMVVVSDMNGQYGSDQYDSEVVQGIDMIIADRPDIVINAGDMVAGQKPKLDYRKMWRGFHAAVTDRLKDAGITMAQVVGNHDGSGYSKYAGEREIYIDEWNQRKPDLNYIDDSKYPLYYSFLYKDVFFIALDASTLEALDDEQYAWLEQQLSHNPSSYRPVIFQHVPLFPITTIKPTEILHDSRLPDLYAKYKVQVVISGHQQAYFPAALNGVIYVHAGALGGGPRPVRQNDGIAPKTLTFVNLYKDHSPYIDTKVINGSKDEKFNHNLLPTYIQYGNNILPRVDIRMEDAEFARDYMISPHLPKSQMQALIKALKEAGGDWGKLPEWK